MVPVPSGTSMVEPGRDTIALSFPGKATEEARCPERVALDGGLLVRLDPE